MNKETFFAYVRKAPFGGRLTQEQVEGLECILGACSRAGVIDPRHIAYILATAFHETGGRMIPVREGFAKSDAAARKIVKKYAYGRPDPQTGHVYYGRGLVQLTWAKNYDKMGTVLGFDLLGNPDLALDPAISAQILVEGMTQGISARGDFTGVSLDDYFNARIDDPLNARRIVNGVDKQKLIASYHEQFLGAVKTANAQPTATLPAEVKPADAKADKPSLMTDKTVLGGITAALGSGGAGLLAAIDNPWAVLAVLIVVVGAILFMTGRLEIRHKAGA